MGYLTRLQVFTLCLSAILVLSLMTPMAGGQDTDKVGLGIQLMQQGDLEKALATFNEAKLRSPEDARLYFFSGLILYRAKQSLQAMAELQKAVELAPDNPRYSLSAAELLLRTGYKFKAMEVLKSFKENIGYEQLSLEEQWSLADLLFRVGMNEEALSVLELYAAGRPDDERLYFRRAQALLMSNQLEQALAAFRAAADETSRKAEANYGIGLVSFRMGEMEQAREALLFSVEQNPLNPEYVHLLSTVLITLGESELALTYLGRVENQGPEFPTIYDAMAKAYRQLKEKDKARIYSQKFVQADSKNRDRKGLDEQIHAGLQAGQGFFKEGKFNEARVKLEEVLELDPENFMAHSYLVGIYGALNAPGQAHEHLVRLQEIDSEAFETQFLTATYLYRMKRTREALEHALKAKQLQPGLAELRNLLGNIYFSLGERAKAVEEYAAAVKLDPEREEFRINYESIAGSSVPQR